MCSLFPVLMPLHSARASQISSPQLGKVIQFTALDVEGSPCRRVSRRFLSDGQCLTPKERMLSRCWAHRVGQSWVNSAEAYRKERQRRPLGAETTLPASGSPLERGGALPWSTRPRGCEALNDNGEAGTEIRLVGRRGCKARKVCQVRRRTRRRQQTDCQAQYCGAKRQPHSYFSDAACDEGVGKVLDMRRRQALVPANEMRPRHSMVLLLRWLTLRLSGRRRYPGDCPSRTAG